MTLVRAGVLEINTGERHLERAVMAANKGFADLVRCPARTAIGLRDEELEHGREIFGSKTAECVVPLVIAIYAPRGDALLGKPAIRGYQGELASWSMTASLSNRI